MEDDRIDLTALAPSQPAWNDAIDRIAARATEVAARRSTWAGQIRANALVAIVTAAAITIAVWTVPFWQPSSPPVRPTLAEQMLDWSTQPMAPTVADTLTALEGGR